VPIGGGALSGKHLSHIDRIGAYAARDAAVRAVQSGAKEGLVRIAYAPNRDQPLDIDYAMEGRGERQPAAFFTHPEMVDRYPAKLITTDRARGLHFFDRRLPWNEGCEGQSGPVIKFAGNFSRVSRNATTLATLKTRPTDGAPPI
jgi:hypothetical protein